jgi:hypothetical protein
MAEVNISVAGQAGAGDANQGKAIEVTGAVANKNHGDDKKPDLVIWTRKPLSTIALQSIIVTCWGKDKLFKQIYVEF